LLSVSSVTDFLGDILANSDWNFLVLGGAMLAGHILTLLQGLVVTNLVRDLTAVLPRNIHTLLFGDIVTHWIGHLLLLGLGHVLAVVVGILLAGPGDLSPDLVVAVALPLELAVLLVLCGALSLRVRFILRLVLVNTDTFVDSVAALLIDGLALLPGGGLMTETQLEFSTLKPPVNPYLAQLLVHSATDLLVVGDALRLLLFLVLGVPHHAVLRPAGD